jgi:quercetin dioxygenase-like cupin family protein
VVWLHRVFQRIAPRARSPRARNAPIRNACVFEQNRSNATGTLIALLRRMTPTPIEARESNAGSEVRSFPIARLDLEEEVRRMRASPRPGGHLGKTLVHNEDLRLVLMVLDRGARIPRHHAKGSLTIQALDGRVIAAILESSFDLGPGQVLAIDRNVSHALVAIEDSALLLTIVP